jgi:hypothetical protein
MGAARDAIDQRQANHLTATLNVFFRPNDKKEVYDLAIICHGRFFTRDAAAVMRTWLDKKGAKETNSDIFIFPIDRSKYVRLIRLVGLGGLDDGLPPGQTMQTVEEKEETSEEFNQKSVIDFGLSVEFQS